MPRFDLTLSFNRLVRISASFSVRTRIVVLALIPVGGFLANGFTYTAGESEVGRAFRTSLIPPPSPTPAATSKARSHRCVLS